jgi:hypothetical protein
MLLELRNQGSLTSFCHRDLGVNRLHREEGSALTLLMMSNGDDTRDIKRGKKLH